MSKPLKPTSVRLRLSQAQSVWDELHAVEVRQVLDPAQEEQRQLDVVDSVDFDFPVVFVGSKRAICEITPSSYVNSLLGKKRKVRCRDRNSR